MWSWKSQLVRQHLGSRKVNALGRNPSSGLGRGSPEINRGREVGLERVVEEAKDEHITTGARGGVKVDGNRKVGLVDACRAQMLCKLVMSHVFGHPDIQETTSGGTDTVDDIREVQ
eukprot:g46785.t1